MCHTSKIVKQFEGIQYFNLMTTKVLMCKQVFKRLSISKVNPILIQQVQIDLVCVLKGHLRFYSLKEEIRRSYGIQKIQLQG